MNTAKKRAPKPAESIAPRLRIRLDPELHEIGDAAIDALRRVDDVYVRCGRLVRIVPANAGSAEGGRRDGSCRVEPVPHTSLLEMLTSVAEFYEVRTRKTGEGGSETYERHVAPPERVARQVSERPSWPGVPTLTAVVDHPVVLASGDIVAEPGFHRPSGIFVSGDLPIGEIPAGRDAARDAADALLELVRDFPFESDAGRTAWLATALTVFARPAIPGPCPMLLIDANTRGAGKTRLADLIGTIATGRSVPRQVVPERDAEMRKRITTVAVAGLPIVLFDNVRGQLGTPSLEAALTADRWQDRLLGSNGLVEMPLQVTWIATGNNVNVTPDILRRVLYSRLVAREERPEERTGFKYPDLLDYARGERATLVRHALTVLANYIRVGRPKQDVSAWGGFEEWSDLIRGAIRWVGLPDPFAARRVLAAADVETEALRMLVGGWPREEGVPLNLCGSSILERWSEPIGHALGALGAKESTVSIGRTLARHHERIVDGWCLHRQKNGNGSWDWTLRAVDELPGARLRSGDDGESGDLSAATIRVETDDARGAK